MDGVDNMMMSFLNVECSTVRSRQGWTGRLPPL